MAMLRIVRVDLTAHAHATEDVNRVRRALLNLLPSELRGKANVSIESLTGHYSNPITRLSLSVVGDDAEKVLHNILSSLSRGDKYALLASLESRYDERSGRLYIRLGKQEAYLGRVRLAEGDDVVRLVVVFQGTPSLEKVVEKLRGLGLDDVR